MARCGCETDCLCVLIDGDCTTFAGSGTVASPYQVNVEISANAGNQVTCEADGLFVSEPTINTLDTDCIDLEGDGSLADPLTATPIISPDLGNVFECRVSGIFVPAAALAAMDRATIWRTAPQIIPATAGAGVGGGGLLEYDTVFEDTSGGLFIDNSLGWLRFEIPANYDGYYLLLMHDRDNALNINLGLDCAGTCGGTDVTRGIQLWVNSAPVVTERSDRLFPEQGAWSASRGMELFAGDIIEGNFDIISQSGATAPHTLVAGTPTIPNFLQIIRISL